MQEINNKLYSAKFDAIEFADKLTHLALDSRKESDSAKSEMISLIFAIQSATYMQIAVSVKESIKLNIE